MAAVVKLARIFEQTLSLSSVSRCLATNQGTSAGGKGLLLSQLPKRPPSSYILFATEKYSQVQQENVGSKRTDVMKIMGAMWSKLDADTKDRYVKEAKERLASYALEKDKMYKSLSAEDLAEISEDKRKVKIRRERIRRNKLNRELNKPKKPPNSGYLIYVADRLREQSAAHGIDDVKQVMKSTTEEWHALTDNSKKTYMDRALTNQREYQNELRQWESKMLKEGHPELIRKSSPVQVKKTSGKTLNQTSKRNMSSKVPTKKSTATDVSKKKKKK